MPVSLTVILMVRDEMKRERPAARLQKAMINRLVESGVISKQALDRVPLPYTLSLLMPADNAHDVKEREAQNKTETSAPPPAEERVRMRMTWLDDPQRQHFEKWAQDIKNVPLYADIDAEPLLMEAVLTSPGPNAPWSRTVSYRMLHAEASDSLRSVTLKFCSPTRLNRAGVPYPLPDPSNIFKGYLHLWNDFSPIPLDPGLRTALEEELLLVDFKIRARPFQEERGTITCFTGSATFRMEGRHPEGVLKGFNALADFSFFCGTGTGRRMGMGLTKRIQDSNDEA